MFFRLNIIIKYFPFFYLKNYYHKKSLIFNELIHNCFQIRQDLMKIDWGINTSTKIKLKLLKLSDK